MRWPNPSRRLNARPLLRDSRSAGFSKDHAHLGGRSAKQKLFSSRSTSFSPGEDSGGQERSPRDQSPLTPRRRTDSPARAAERRPRRKLHRFQPLTDDPPPGGPGHLPDVGPAPRGAARPPCRVPAPARCPPSLHFIHSFTVYQDQPQAGGGRGEEAALLLERGNGGSPPRTRARKTRSRVTLYFASAKGGSTSLIRFLEVRDNRNSCLHISLQESPSPGLHSTPKSKPAASRPRSLVSFK